MAKTLDDTVIDASLNVVKNGATQMAICSAQPMNYAEATATYMLALKTGLTAGSFIGPVNGTSSGRKLTKTAETGISVTNGGGAAFVALCSGSVLLLVDTCTPQVLTAGNTVNTPAFEWEIADPS
jgi:hypothetical protein